MGTSKGWVGGGYAPRSPGAKSPKAKKGTNPWTLKEELCKNSRRGGKEVPATKDVVSRHMNGVTNHPAVLGKRCCLETVWD
ncbi:rCG24968 [Rattus norvegicus]|uniref:RCG24968 n=1 Tax=Rattus norvegicus TaxID=10116 RepID=A6KLU3_RAT|nr:rCG24968 [Rattus norvegicus]